MKLFQGFNSVINSLEPSQELCEASLKFRYNRFIEKLSISSKRIECVNITWLFHRDDMAGYDHDYHT